MYKKRGSPSDNGSSIAAVRIVAGGLFGFVLTCLLTYFSALGITKEMLAADCTGWLGPVIILLSGMFCAIVSTKANGKKLVCALLASLLYGSVMIICGLLLFSAPMQIRRMMLSLSALLAGTFAGVLISSLRG